MFCTTPIVLTKSCLVLYYFCANFIIIIIIIVVVVVVVICKFFSSVLTEACIDKAWFGFNSHLWYCENQSYIEKKTNH